MDPPLSLRDTATAACRAIVACPALRVRGGATGYRNKVTYTLEPVVLPARALPAHPPEAGDDAAAVSWSSLAQRSAAVRAAVGDGTQPAALPVTDQAAPVLNAYAQRVWEFATRHSALPAAAAVADPTPQCSKPRPVPTSGGSQFWLEVAAKVTRRGEVQLKLAVRDHWAAAPSGAPHPPGSLLDWWLEHEAPRLLAFLQALDGTTVDLAPDPLFDDASARGGEGLDLPRRARLVSVVCHATAEATGKPAKAPDDDGADEPAASRYVPLTADGLAPTVVELTGNGAPYALSADSFSEVNHAMEAALLRFSLEDCLGLPFHRGGAFADAAAAAADVVADGSPGAPSFDAGVDGFAGKGRAVFLTGRDVNGQHASVQHCYRDRVVACTGCPRAQRDHTTNRVPAFCGVPKHRVGPALSTAIAGDLLPPAVAASRAPLQWDVLATAGRHGLHPLAVAAVADEAHRALHRGATEHRGGWLGSVVYVSCNVVSMARDLDAMKDAVVVRRCQTYDFFPGTAYCMTALHLVPRAFAAAAHSAASLSAQLPPPWRCLCAPGAVPANEAPLATLVAWRSDLTGAPPSDAARTPEAAETLAAPSVPLGAVLVLPLGPPGVGKTSTAAAIAAALADPLFPSFPSRPPKARRPKTQRSGTEPATGAEKAVAEKAAAVVARVRPPVPTAATARCLERDAVFAERRAAGDGLNKARRATHDAMMNFLRSGGAVGAQPLADLLFLDSVNAAQEARDLYAATFAAGPGRPVLTLWFEEPPRAELVRRIGARVGHPAFETSADEGAVVTKLENVAKVLQPPGDPALVADGSAVAVLVPATSASVAYAATAAICALWLHPQLLAVLAAGARSALYDAVTSLALP